MLIKVSQIVLSILKDRVLMMSLLTSTKIKKSYKGNFFTPRWGFLTPSLLFLFIMAIFPLAFSLVITFTDMRLLAEKTSFIGLTNWKKLLSDKNAFIVLRNTVVFVGIGCIIQYAIGLLMAILINLDVKGRTFFRIIFLLPMMVAPIAISYVIGKMVFSESYGPINDILFRIGLSPFAWSISQWKSMAVIISIDTWQNVPFFILVLLAGLQSIPDELFEAARVDGATNIEIFFHIIFPLMIPISITTIIIRALNAFQVIDIIRIVTGGGPGNSTESATLFAYDIGIKGQDIAYGSTIALGLLIVVGLFTVLFLTFGRLVTPKK